MFYFDRKEEFFYFDELIEGDLEHFYEMFSKEPCLSKNLPKIFQNFIFKNSNCLNPIQKINNYDLSKKLQKENKYFIYYSNFDVIKYASKFLHEIYDILINEFKNESISVFVFNHNIPEEKIKTFIEFSIKNTSFVDNFYIMQQKRCKKTNVLMKNIKDQILLENHISYFNKDYTFKEKYYFNNLFFEISKFIKVCFYLDKIIKRNFKNYTKGETLSFEFGDLNTKINYKFNYCYVTGKFHLNVINENDNLKFRYLLLIHNGIEYNSFSDYTLCVSIKKYENSNFFCGKIVSYDQFLNFTNFVYYLFKNDVKLNIIIESYSIKSFFVINNYNYPRSGIIKKLLIKDTEVTCNNIQKLLKDNYKFKYFNVLELEYQRPIFKFESHKHFLLDILKNMYNTRKIVNKELLADHTKNFLFEVGVNNDVNIGILIIEKTHRRSFPFFN